MFCVLRPNLCHRRIPEVVKDREKDAIWPCRRVKTVIHEESEFVVHTNNTINEGESRFQCMFHYVSREQRELKFLLFYKKVYVIIVNHI